MKINYKVLMEQLVMLYRLDIVLCLFILILHQKFF